MFKENIYIRNIEEIDLSRTLKWINDPEIKRDMSINIEITEDSQKQWFNNLYSNKNPINIVFAICLKQNNTHIGNVNLSLIDYKNKNARFAIFIADKKNRGKGYGFEASKKAIDYGFDILGLNKIYLKTTVDNLPAIAMYEKLGFKIEGRLIQHEYHIDKFVDKFIYGLLNKEYKKQ